MVVVRTDSFIAPSTGFTNFSQSAFVDALKNAFSLAGYGNAPFDDYVTGTDRFLIYQLVFDSSKNYGTVYLQIKITSGLAITQRLYTAWNATPHTGSNPGSETGSIALNNATRVDFMGLTKSPEMRLVMVYQGATILYLGYLRPEFKPAWWDENAYPYCLILNSLSPPAQWFLAGIYPFTGALTTGGRVVAQLGQLQMGSPSPISARRDIVPGVLFFANSNEGIAGRSSSDFAMVASSGLIKQDIIQVTPGLEEYVLLSGGTGGAAARII